MPATQSETEPAPEPSSSQLTFGEAVIDGVTLGETETLGVTDGSVLLDGVTLGVFETEILGVTLRLTDGVTLGVFETERLGLTLGVTLGVFETEILGVTLGVTDGSGLGEGVGVAPPIVFGPFVAGTLAQPPLPAPHNANLPTKVLDVSFAN